MKFALSIVVSFFLGATSMFLYGEWSKIEPLAAGITFDIEQLKLIEERKYDALTMRINQKLQLDYYNFSKLCDFYNCLENSEMKMHYQYLMNEYSVRVDKLESGEN